MKIAILGYGVEGKETLKFVKNKYPKAKISILDAKRDKNYLENLVSFDIIFRSPGVPYYTKEVQKAVRAGVKVTSAIDTFLGGARGTIVGVTGTKGKSTTATLIYEILKAAKKDVYLGGNVGNSPLGFIQKLRKNSISVLELSSFQLQGITASPNVAVVLDVFPDHMDYHKNFKEYVSAKAGIVKYQNKNDVVYYVPTSKTSRSIAKLSAGQKIPISPHEFPIDLKIHGLHNKQNAAMAAAVASRFGVSPIVSLDIITKFGGLPNRLKFVSNIGGVSFYNDSASTNPQTTVAALQSFPGIPKILIAGGRDKNLDFKILKKVIEKENVRAVILFGECKEKIGKAIGNACPIHYSSTLEGAVKAALSKSLPRDVVLFSPGAASFDMFENYKERGKKFEAIVKKLRR